MLVKKTGPLGICTGSVGDVVYSRYDGKTIVKEKPKKSVKEASPAQLVQRQKMMMVQSFLQGIAGVIKLGYRSYTNQSIPARSAALSQILRDAVIGDQFPMEIDYSKVLISYNRFRNDVYCETVAEPGRRVRISWEQVWGLHGDMSNSDGVVIVLYSKAKNVFVTELNVCRRCEGVYTVELPAEFENDLLVGWMFFASENRKFTSRSVYLGEVLVMK